MHISIIGQNVWGNVYKRIMISYWRLEEKPVEARGKVDIYDIFYERLPTQN